MLIKELVMRIKSEFGIRFFLIAVITIFLLPASSAALVEMYINDENMLVNEKDQIIFQGGKDLELIIRLDGDYRMDSSNNEALSVQKMSITVEFLNDDDNRGTTSGIPNRLPDSEDASITYEGYESIFRSSDPIFKDYDGDIRFSVLLKNKTSVVVKDEQFVINIEAASSGGSDAGGFSMPSLNLPEPIQENLMIILVGIVGLIILSVGVYKFVLAPEDTTADLFREKEAINPLSKSLTGVDYEAELPSESKLKRLENSKSDEEEEDDDEYVDIDDDDDKDEDFDESALLASLTGGPPLKSNNDEEEEKPKAKKKVKRKIAKKGVAKKKVVRKAPPKKATKPTEPEVSMGKGVNRVQCPSCEKVHNVEDNINKFICTCGRRIRV